MHAMLDTSMENEIQLRNSDLSGDVIKKSVAVIGMACRFPPDCDSPKSFWNLLERGGQAMSDVPRERFAAASQAANGSRVSLRGGYLTKPSPDQFDAAFFKVSSQEALALDPQQRFLLEVCWDAVENAGWPAEKLHGRPVGVYVGISTADYHGARLWNHDLPEVDPFTATGAAFSAASGRVSHFFGCEGPSLSVDTACSSSLVAFHLACQAIRQQECEAALVAGVNALLAPNLFFCLSRMGLLSADGKCKSFDASGDGYVRSEGCGVLVLKELDAALRDGDPVLAVCRSSAVNHGGKGQGLTAPSKTAQANVIRQALRRAGFSPNEVQYVEAHGTGTPLGDTTELEALVNTYCAARESSNPLLIGSVKTNIGHLEAAAGIAGVIKTILCLRHGQIPAHLHFQRPNPHIPWEQYPIVVPRELTPWPKGAQPRRAGVSSFGFSGTNAHVILEEAPSEGERASSPAPSPSLQVLPLSAKSPEALRELAAAYVKFLGETGSALADICFTAGVGRSHFGHRMAVVGSTVEEVRETLQQRLDGENVRSWAAGNGTVGNAKLRASNTEAGSLPRDDTSLEQTVRTEAEWYAQGKEVDWIEFAAGHRRRKVELPNYPFQRKSYYINPVSDYGVPPASAPRPGSEEPWGQNVQGVHPLKSETEAQAKSESARVAARLREGGPAAWLAFLNETARKILHDETRPPLENDLPLVQQGFASLLAVEFRDSLERALSVSLPVTFLYNYPSLRGIAGFLQAELSRNEETTREAPPIGGANPPPPRQRKSGESAPVAEFGFLDELEPGELKRLIEHDIDLI